jgi:hypothetical protein
MKQTIIKITLITVFAFLVGSCTKIVIPVDVTGRYFSQINNSPYGNIIDLFGDNSAEINYGNDHLHCSYYISGSNIHFSNGYVANLYGTNELVFNETIEYLNPQYYDGDGDGYDDWDYTIPHYILESNSYYYNR